jgi:hypothetical protein
MVLHDFSRRRIAEALRADPERELIEPGPAGPERPLDRPLQPGRKLPYRPSRDARRRPIGPEGRVDSLGYLR